jgi:hypothetical protein
MSEDKDRQAREDAYDKLIAKLNGASAEQKENAIRHLTGLGAVVEMDGKSMLINILMSALRRHVIVSLGGTIDGDGFNPGGEDAVHIDAAEVKEGMVRLAAQGLHDVIHTGFLPMDVAKAFSIEVCDVVSRQQLERAKKGKP